MLAARMVGLAFSNGPAAIPPWGGHEPILSTGPIAAGFPGSPSPAIVDLSTSAISRGVIAQAAAAGRRLPDGVAFDSEGRPTTDAQAALAGMLAPMGGAKGFSLGFLVEAITGALVGPRLSSEIADPLNPEAAGASQRVALLLLAINPISVSPDGSAHERWARLQHDVSSAGGRSPGSGRPLDPPDSHPLTLARNVVAAVAEAVRSRGVALPESWTRALS
jgi:(2R)-3-sulfolactate dehydrogenase (NADP+)